MTFELEADRLPRIKSNLERRSLIFELTRRFFVELGFLEVETPTRVPSVAPEQFIIPYASDGWFLSTSPELHMKRLLAAGYDRLFQICRCFRSGESGQLHNPEFTMLEWYRRGSTYHDMMNDTELLVATLARQLGFGHCIPYLGDTIDLTSPWPNTSVKDAFSRVAGWDPVAAPDAERFDLDLVMKVIPSMDPSRPAILSGYPATMASLSKLDSTDNRVAERAEVFIAGLELANAYTELTDPGEQAHRFQEEAGLIIKSGGDATIPSRFLEAMHHLPECGGIALGMDRLVMLLCGSKSIEDVVAFPHEWV